MSEEETEMKAMTGVILDADNKFALVIVSDQAVGVSKMRFQEIPPIGDVEKHLKRGQWIVIQRDQGESLFSVQAETDAVAVELDEEDTGSAKLAISIALQSWPEWGDDLRGQIEPRWPMPFPTPDQPYS